MRLINDTIEKAERYTERVRGMEQQIKIARFQMETDEYQELVKNLDLQRRLAHEALIDQLKATNKHLFKEYKNEIPVGGVFIGDVERFHDRTVIGDWAGELVRELEEFRRQKEEIQERGILYLAL